MNCPMAFKSWKARGKQGGRNCVSLEMRQNERRRTLHPTSTEETVPHRPGAPKNAHVLQERSVGIRFGQQMREATLRY